MRLDDEEKTYIEGNEFQKTIIVVEIHVLEPNVERLQRSVVIEAASQQIQKGCLLI